MYECASQNDSGDPLEAEKEGFFGGYHTQGVGSSLEIDENEQRNDWN